MSMMMERVGEGLPEEVGGEGIRSRATRNVNARAVATRKVGGELGQLTEVDEEGS